ncbi:MAG TPA: hypothetical protein VGI78_03805 [Acetobacteraceae bacterium]
MNRLTESKAGGQDLTLLLSDFVHWIGANEPAYIRGNGGSEDIGYAPNPLDHQSYVQRYDPVGAHPTGQRDRAIGKIARQQLN